MCDFLCEFRLSGDKLTVEFPLLEGSKSPYIGNFTEGNVPGMPRAETYVFTFQRQPAEKPPAPRPADPGPPPAGAKPSPADALEAELDALEGTWKCERVELPPDSSLDPAKLTFGPMLRFAADRKAFVAIPPNQNEQPLAYDLKLGKSPAQLLLAERGDGPRPPGFYPLRYRRDGTTLRLGTRVAEGLMPFGAVPARGDQRAGDEALISSEVPTPDPVTATFVYTQIDGAAPRAKYRRDVAAMLQGEWEYQPPTGPGNFLNGGQLVTAMRRLTFAGQDGRAGDGKSTWAGPFEFRVEIGPNPGGALTLTGRSESGEVRRLRARVSLGYDDSMILVAARAAGGDELFPVVKGNEPISYVPGEERPVTFRRAKTGAAKSAALEGELRNGSERVRVVV